MPVREDAWLAERLARQAFTVAADTPTAEVEEHIAAGTGLRFYQMRIRTDRVDDVRVFTELGFYVVEATLVFGRMPEALPAEAEVVVGQAEHRDAVVEIGRTSFRYSRFHLDPAVPREVADRIKGDWVASYFAGSRGDHILVGLLDGRPAGFLAVLATEVEGRKLRTIDLVATAPTAQGRGLARAMTARFLADAAGTADEVIVGTQVSNIPATRLYEAMGFRMERAEYALHLHAS